jgi:uracil-DNA glycosylase
MRTLAEAALDASTCTKCRLLQGRTQVVYGVGDPTADLMFIGEAPGFHEDKQGEPFVGAAGQLLNQLLSEVGNRAAGRRRVGHDRRDRPGRAPPCRPAATSRTTS